MKIDLTGVILLEPVEDLAGIVFWLVDLVIYKFRIGVKGKTPLDPLNPPMTIKERIYSYKQTYLNRKRKVFNPYFRYFFQDPLVSILWWFQYLTLILRASDQLGK